MNREVKKLKKWLDANQLPQNIDKTNYVIFHSAQKKIEWKTLVKFLGVLYESAMEIKSGTSLSNQIQAGTSSNIKVKK